MDNVVNNKPETWERAEVGLAQRMCMSMYVYCPVPVTYNEIYSPCLISISKQIDICSPKSNCPNQNEVKGSVELRPVGFRIM